MGCNSDFNVFWRSVVSEMETLYYGTGILCTYALQEHLVTTQLVVPSSVVGLIWRQSEKL